MIAWSWKNISGSIVRLLQKVFRGFSDAECWELHMVIADFVLPRLRRYRKMERYGYPGMVIGETEEEFENFNPEDDLVYVKKWNGILDKMILAFELIKREDDSHSGEMDALSHPGWIKVNEKQREQIREGLELFARYYGCLWD